MCSSSQYSNYNTAINYLVTVPKYRIQAQEIARQEGLLSESTKKGRGGKKSMSKQEEETILKQIVEQKMDMKGGYKKPSMKISLEQHKRFLFSKSYWDLFSYKILSHSHNKF